MGKIFESSVFVVTKFSMRLFILQIVLVLSLGTMIYLIARAVPRVSDEVTGGAIKRRTKFDHLFSFLWIEKIDPLLNNFLEKFLRKMKLVLMKLDNITNNYLNKVKKYKSDSNGKNGEEKQNVFDDKIEEE